MAADRDPPLIRLLPLLRREWLHHPWRQVLLVLAVALGVALAFSVQVINHSALAEFGAAVRSVNGEPDLSLRAASGALREEWLDRAALHPGVRQASPVLEVQTYAQAADGRRLAVRVLGVDALQVAAVAPQLLPQPAAGEDRLVFFDPGATFANATARERLALADGAVLRLQVGPTWQTVRLAGHVAAAGAPVLVMDVAAAQALFGMDRLLTRLDLRLAPGQRVDELLRELALPADVQAAAPDEAQQRLSTLSRAYRVNLTVLGLVALFVGGFLVFSVLSLSVAQRTPGLALLGVLGLTAGERRRLVLAECALLGAVGSGAGLVLGAALAWLALRVLGGDLGGGYFPGVQPALQLDVGVAAVCAALGLITALAGGWLPARRAERLAPAQALKGLGGNDGKPVSVWVGVALLLAGGGLALLPPVAGVPLAAYAAVAALLFGGVALVPAMVQLMLRGRGGSGQQQAQPLLLLALRRAAFQRATASAAVAGVVASLALSVALTVMVASFRDSVSAWLDGVLPADLYARSAGSSSAADLAWFDADLLHAVAGLPGVQRVQASRVRPLALAPGRPGVSLLARPIDDPARQLPLQGPVLPGSAGEVGVWVSEAMVALYGAGVGQALELPLRGAGEPPVTVRVLGVWRDFARQFGSVAIDLATYQRLSGDRRLNELALWLAPGADVVALQTAIRARLADPTMLEFAATTELRSISLRIFDRSFAVTYYLQAVAITIGLVGIGASLSAQVLARRKEFGLLAHLGLTRRQVLALVAGEGAAWLAAGTAIGLLLGLLISAVLVHVVNPQSFHWTMDLSLPAGRLAALCAAVLATGIATAAFAARRALSRAAVLAVKEDW
jgi:putative ABC transport system permease protein